MTLVWWFKTILNENFAGNLNIRGVWNCTPALNLFSLSRFLTKILVKAWLFTNWTLCDCLACSKLIHSNARRHKTYNLIILFFNSSIWMLIVIVFKLIITLCWFRFLRSKHWWMIYHFPAKNWTLLIQTRKILTNLFWRRLLLYWLFLLLFNSCFTISQLFILYFFSG